MQIMNIIEEFSVIAGRNEVVFFLKIQMYC